MAIEKTKADRYKQDQMTEFVQTLLNLQSALQEFSQQQQMFTQKVLEIVVNPFAVSSWSSILFYVISFDQDFHKQGELVIKNLVAEEQKVSPFPGRSKIINWADRLHRSTLQHMASSNGKSQYAAVLRCGYKR